MARVATTDLFLLFTIGATSYPSTTQGTAVITALYKEAYGIIYGPKKYSSDESTDLQGLIASEDVFVIIQREASDIIDAWHFSGIDIPRPSIAFSKQAVNEIIDIVIVGVGIMDNVRIRGSDYGDYEGVNR